MDIRLASRNTGAPCGMKEGTVPPATLTEEKAARPVPEVDGEATIKGPLEEFGPESVISQYLDFLHARNITDDDIRDVLECLITSGNVSWRFELFDRIPVEFRVRPSWVDDYILELIDREAADNERVSLMRYNNMVAVCNLAASMTAFKDETYRVETREDFRWPGSVSRTCRISSRMLWSTNWPCSTGQSPSQHLTGQSKILRNPGRKSKSRDTQALRGTIRKAQYRIPLAA